MGSHRPSPFILDLFWFAAYCRWPLVSSDHPQHQVGSFGMTEDNTVTVLGIASSWVAYTSLEVTWAVLPPALTLVVRECMHAVRDVFTTAATAHVASCNHYGLHREFSHIPRNSPVPARSVCGNFRVHRCCLQDQLNTIWEMWLRALVVLPAANERSSSLSGPFSWVPWGRGSHREQAMPNAVWAKQSSLHHHGHFDFPIVYPILFLHSLNPCYASFSYPLEISSYWGK